MRRFTPSNVYDNIPEEIPEELFEVLARGRHVQIERIVSRGHGSAPGFWYDQDTAEYILLLKGRAGLRFDGEKDIRVMKPGDWLIIEAHRKHRVEWTDPRQETIWLAVHYG